MSTVSCRISRTWLPFLEPRFLVLRDCPAAVRVVRGIGAGNQVAEAAAHEIVLSHSRLVVDR